MKGRRTLIFIAMLAVASLASAQNTRTIKGAVISKKEGIPLTEAYVQATGGSEITTVDADGSFTLEVPIWLKSVTARCEGMANKTLKVSDNDMIFYMRPEISFTKCKFITGNYSYFRGFDNLNCHLFGVMYGNLGKWGWYGKANFGFASPGNCFTFTMSGGVTKRIMNRWHAYLGAGGGMMDGWGLICPEIGSIFLFGNRFAANIGFTPTLAKDNGGLEVFYGFNIGFGYAF